MKYFKFILLIVILAVSAYSIDYTTHSSAGYNISNSPIFISTSKLGAVMAYADLEDTSDFQDNQYHLIYGGYDGGVYLNETWEYVYEHNTYQKRWGGVGAPLARAYSAMVFDKNENKFVLFGGYDGFNGLEDTWTYDAVAHKWVDVSPVTSPDQRRLHSMAFDVDNNVTILFGGDETTILNYFNDTWMYNASSNTWTNLTMTGSPYPSSAGAMAYDSESQRFIYFGGRDGWPPLNLFNDTYAGQLNAAAGTITWTNMTPTISGVVSKRADIAMVYDEFNDRVVLYGGYDGVNYLDEVWDYDFNTNTWALGAGTVTPNEIAYHAMSYDSDWKKILTFGGYNNTGGGTYSAETWEYSFFEDFWVQKTYPNSGPMPRYSTEIVHSPVYNKTLILGGRDDTWNYRDSWYYSSKTGIWQQLTSTDSRMGYRFEHSSAYDSSRDKAWFMGGTVNVNPGFEYNDTWSWQFSNHSLTNANAMMVGESIPLIRKQEMVYDSDEDNLVLFGGEVGAAQQYTWTYDITTNWWTNTTPVLSPNVRYDLGLAYDSTNIKSILFGGWDGIGPVQDTWNYTYLTNTWGSSGLAVALPGVRYGQEMIFDPILSVVTMFAGYDNIAVAWYSDTWEYDFAANTWTQRVPATNPSARRNFGMSYDTTHDKTYLFGGEDAFGENNDFWQYMSSTYSWRDLSCALAPGNPNPGRDSTTSGATVDNRQCMLFGGQDEWGVELDETYIYDTREKVWLRVEECGGVKPGARNSAMMAYSTADKKYIMFGGDNLGALANTWMFDAENYTWRNMVPIAAPGARSDGTMAYSTADDVFIVFGGTNWAGANYNDTWEYDYNTNTWADKVAWNAPYQNYGAQLVYDQEEDLFIFYGGFTAAGGLLSETWSYDYGTNTWANLTAAVSGSPSGTAYHSMVYDSTQNVTVWFGGGNAALTPMNEMWTFDYGTLTWTQVTLDQTPEARMYHFMCYDSQEDTTVMALGHNTGGSQIMDTWLFKPGEAAAGGNTPVIENITISPDPINLQVGADTAVTGAYVVSDADGAADIDTTLAQGFFFDVSEGMIFTQNNNSNYINNSCSWGAAWGTDYKNLTCTFYMRPYANAATWNATANVTDLSSNYATLVYNSTTVNPLVALHVTVDPVDFGNLDPGEISAVKTVPIDNTGNVKMDMLINGTDLPCGGIGTVDVGSVRASISIVVPWIGWNVLSHDKEFLTSFNVTKPIDDTGQFNNSVWAIDLPYGCKGACAGQIQMTAHQA